jgi:DNA-directed RNA polymerase II subunit RPB1
LSTLSSKQVLRDHRLTREAFDWLIGEIEVRFWRVFALIV